MNGLEFFTAYAQKIMSGGSSDWQFREVRAIVRGQRFSVRVQDIVGDSDTEDILIYIEDPYGPEFEHSPQAQRAWEVIEWNRLSPDVKDYIKTLPDLLHCGTWKYAQALEHAKNCETCIEQIRQIQKGEAQC